MAKTRYIWCALQFKLFVITELFDDNTFDDYTNHDWITKAFEEKQQHHALTGKGLFKNQDDQYEWRPLTILDYDVSKEKFIAKWNDSLSDETHLVSRINFCLDAEDPRKFAKRVANAH